MAAMFLVSIDNEVVHGEPVFKGTRLPVEILTGNVDSFMEVDGLTEDGAIQETLKCFPSVPRSAAGIRAILDFRKARG